MIAISSSVRRPGLKDVIRRPDLAHVMHGRGTQDAFAQFRFKPQALGNQLRVVGHAQNVGAGFRVAEFGCAGQTGNGLPFACHDVCRLVDDGLAQVVVPAA
jgi:hypothetical protein